MKKKEVKVEEIKINLGDIKKDKKVMMVLTLEELGCLIGTHMFLRETAKAMAGMAKGNFMVDPNTLAGLDKYLQVLKMPEFIGLEEKFDKAIHEGGVCTNPNCPHTEEQEIKHAGGFVN